MTDPVNIDDIRAAAARIAPHARVTPLEKSYGLSELTGAEVYLKYDSLQVTGSFKFRGALNMLSMLTDAEIERGIVVASSGNHGMAISRASGITGIPIDLYLVSSVSPVKLSAVKGMGVDPIMVDSDDSYLAETTAKETAAKTGKQYISPYNDPRIIAGQGTCGLEIAEAMPDADAVFVSVGGGGLICGIGLALEALAPNAKLVGCWPEASDALKVSLERGEITDTEHKPTLSDGTAGNVEPGSITLELGQRLIKSTALVSEERIASSMRLMAEHERQIIEGAAGVALGAFLDQADEWKGKKVVIVICGRNVAFDIWLEAVNT